MFYSHRQSSIRALPIRTNQGFVAHTFLPEGAGHLISLNFDWLIALGTLVLTETFVCNSTVILTGILL